MCSSDLCFYSLSNELSNKSFVILFLYFGMLILCRNKTCVFVLLIFVFFFFFCFFFVLDSNVRICIILKL